MAPPRPRRILLPGLGILFVLTLLFFWARMNAERLREPLVPGNLGAAKKGPIQQ